MTSTAEAPEEFQEPSEGDQILANARDRDLLSRRGLIWVSGGVIERLLDLPEDVHIVGMNTNPDTSGIFVHVVSPRFDAVSEGWSPSLTYTARTEDLEYHVEGEFDEEMRTFARVNLVDPRSLRDETPPPSDPLSEMEEALTRRPWLTTTSQPTLDDLAAIDIVYNDAVLDSEQGDDIGAIRVIWGTDGISVRRGNA